MAEETVVFKGNRDGLYLMINNENDLEILKKKIQEKIASAQCFFQGIKKIKLSGTSLSRQDLNDLANWLEERYQIKIVDIKKENNEEGKSLFKLEQKIHNYPIKEGMTKFIYTTLRSGSRIQYDGNIVIIGDVNPGAEVIATGNIIVIGALRGIAHAGYLGNNYACVIAFSLQPTQLRISNIITRAPDQQDFKPTCPEKACIKEDSIVILPYYKNL
ncbi:septum site-determining protein MinC [Garciella nitratireducens]|uniref:Probable septum site-determining protein MinC n=1 Tax=Garciella nitratireducens DSM 15102 TaxID=1121911 RepID=A0A1T4K9B2_9FIRM|nr:septum site-determining protein MinC [Garciella nitratireducens]RBP46710.1 septum site-determining protein MinC [Garciella nitratireducens]SJZ38986.1 septum site-determining protein MinC [Garciella nitratireducens DSM 15102]